MLGEPRPPAERLHVQQLIEQEVQIAPRDDPALQRNAVAPHVHSSVRRHRLLPPNRLFLVSLSRSFHHVAEAGEVVRGIAEGGVDRGEALEVVADDQLVHDAHAAVELHGLLARAAESAESARIAARHAIERASAAAMNMSAMRCLRTWKVPIATPNCLRVFRYSSVWALSASMQPTASAHRAAIARSMPRSRIAAPAPSSPSNAERSTATSVNVT